MPNLPAPIQDFGWLPVDGWLVLIGLLGLRSKYINVK
jgi:hypothetical protein